MMTMIKMIVRNSSIAGMIDAPPSKSYTHRAIICASLASGTSTIHNPLLSGDIEATLAACEALGAEIIEKNSERIVIKGTGGELKVKSTTINCNESGSTLRFAIPLAALADKDIAFIGKPGLATRPIDDLLGALAQLGVKSEYNGDKALPVKIHGAGKLSGGKITIRGNVSSQFISGLLFALPLADNDSEILITTELESRDYIEITLDILKKFGINIEHSKDLIEFKIKGKQKYKSCEYTVEGDYSSAAFILVAGAIAGNGVTINNLNKNSKQGDRRIVDLLKEMGAKIKVGENSVSIERSELKAIPIDAKDIPDLIPILAIAATQANFTTVIKNVGRLRLKESDRLQGVLNIITALGGSAKIENNSIAIRGIASLKGAEIETLNDHRLVMAASVAGLVANGETVIREPTAIKKSYPLFFDDLRKLGADTMSMSNTFGNSLKIILIGESHGKRIGVLVQGVPKGIKISQEFIQSEVDKRRSVSSLTTPRRESDQINIVSGIKDGKTTGETIRMEIENKDVKSESYEKMRNLIRPGHADYTAREKYASVFDYRGGGFLSGRMTACYVAAGAIAKKILEQLAIKVLAHTIQVGSVKVEREINNKELEQNRFKNLVRCADLEKAKEMEKAIENAKSENDSLGGIIECRVLNMPVGVGEPVFYSLESELAQAMFAIPAVKGIEFGSGFKAASMHGSEHNDPIKIENDKVVTITNNAGGIQGGLSNGMPIVFRIAIKPTSSIAKEQQTVDIKKMEDTKIAVLGRHDPCIAIRAPPIVEAMAALSIADLLLTGNFIR